MADEDWFAHQLTALLPRVRRFAIGLSGSVAEGDDLVQAALERAWAGRAHWQPEGRLDSWLFKLVQNLWIDDRRRAGRWRTETDEGVVEAISGGDAEHQLEQRLVLGAVERAILALPDGQREVLLLVTVEGLSYREAADILSVPIGTVMSRLARARLALGRMIGEAAPAAAE